jgi:ribose-phosphate pyrophosphokinase
LASAVASALGVPLYDVRSERHPDGERAVAVSPALRGKDAYVIQPTGPPVDEHLIELLWLVDACRRAGAARVSAVVPYFGYARQDRRGSAGEALGLRMALELVRAARTDRLVVVDPHTSSFESATGLAVETVAAMPILVAAARPLLAARPVFVSPDLGAAKLAERWSREFDAPSAIVRKTRVSGESVRAEEVLGDLADRSPVIVDDMISTGGTVEAAVRALRARGCTQPPTVIATHALLVGPALARLSALSLNALIVADTLPLPRDLPLRLTVARIGARLADALARLHHDRPLDHA